MVNNGIFERIEKISKKSFIKKRLVALGIELLNTSDILVKQPLGRTLKQIKNLGKRSYIQTTKKCMVSEESVEWAVIQVLKGIREKDLLFAYDPINREILGYMSVDEGEECRNLPKEIFNDILTLWLLCTKENSKGIGNLLMVVFLFIAKKIKKLKIILEVASSTDGTEGSLDNRHFSPKFDTNMEAYCFYEKYGFKHDPTISSWKCFSPKDKGTSIMTLDLTTITMDDIEKMSQQKYQCKLSPISRRYLRDLENWKKQQNQPPLLLLSPETEKKRGKKRIRDHSEASYQNQEEQDYFYKSKTVKIGNSSFKLKIKLPK